MRLHKYTLEQLKSVVKNTTSIREALTQLGVKPMGGNYDIFRKAVKHFEIDTSHFTGMAGSGAKQKGRYRPRIDTEVMLTIGSGVQSNNLRIRLLREGYFEHVCSSCKLTEWLGNTIPLELDHINGNSQDNRLENLRLLCPNCHTLTPTYRGRNKVCG